MKPDWELIRHITNVVQIDMLVDSVTLCFLAFAWKLYHSTKE